MAGLSQLMPPRSALAMDDANMAVFCRWPSRKIDWPVTASSPGSKTASGAGVRNT